MMFSESQSSLLNSGSALAFVAYGLISAFIFGPEIVERESQKLGWPQICKRIVVAELQQSMPEPETIPNLDYRDLTRSWLGRDADPLLRLMQPMTDMIDQAREQKERARQWNEERLRQKAEAAGSRCNCAVSMLTENRVDLALYAGSGRLVTPPMFKNLKSELETALRNPRCSGGKE